MISDPDTVVRINVIPYRPNQRRITCKRAHFHLDVCLPMYMKKLDLAQHLYPLQAYFRLLYR